MATTHGGNGTLNLRISSDEKQFASSERRSSGRGGGDFQSFHPLPLREPEVQSGLTLVAYGAASGEVGYGAFQRRESRLSRCSMYSY